MGDDGEYREPDMRFINFLRMTKYERDHLWTFDEYLKKLDDEDQKQIDAAEKERRLMFTDFFKKVYKFARTKTFTYGGTK